MNDISRGTHAANLAARGFNVFQLRPNSKEPAINDWPNRSTRDAGKVARAWTNEPERNIAIHTNTHNGAPIFVLDIDDKVGKNGSAELALLEAKHGKLPETLTTVTPSGGRHLFFYCQGAVGNSAGKVAPSIDVRGSRGYVAAPGSTINGKAYAFADPNKRIVQAPAWLYKLVRDTGTAAELAPIDRTPLPGVDADRATARALAYLASAPLAIEGSAGDSTTFRVAAALKDQGCTEAQALDLMAEHWNQRCSPPWALDDLAAKIQHAYKYGKEQPGIDAPEAVFAAAPLPASASDDNAAHPLEKLNEQYAFVLVGGAGYILWETEDEDGRPSIELLTESAFHKRHASITLQTGKRSRPLTEEWIEWPGRRSYDKITYKPGKDLPARFFNQWRGFAVEPKAGDWSKMQALIRDIICAGDPNIHRYVMGWMAKLIQSPGEPGHVALVMRSGEGTGKGTLAWALRLLLGHHSVHLSHSKHLTGGFNKHLAAVSFVFADEAFWSGDKQGRGALFSLITEDKILIEAKGKDAVMQDNTIHLMMASNHEWVIPASADSRRFCVIDVAEHQKGNIKYFEAVRKQMREGGAEAMLHDLLAYDLSDFNVWDIPQTKALADQKMASLEGPARWLHDRLYDAAVGSVDWGAEPLALPVKGTYQLYVDSVKSTRDFKPVDVSFFWKEVKRLLTDSEGRSVQDTRPRVDGKPERQKLFPPLAAARAAFAANMRVVIDWPVDELDEAPVKPPRPVKRRTAAEMFNDQPND